MAAKPSIRAIPSSDAGFRQHVERLVSRHAFRTPAELEVRLRNLFPRVTVRARDISGEDAVTWYVYRDGSWRPPDSASWWLTDEPARVELDGEGWITRANPLALSLLGVADLGSEPRHFSDFVAPGTLEDAVHLFDIVAGGADFAATMLMRPEGGDLIACEIRAFLDRGTVAAVFRLADDIAVASAPGIPPAELTTSPPSDAAFRGYAERALARMPEPTPAGLVLRLRRLYPHARVEAAGDRWHAFRDPIGVVEAKSDWWRVAGLARVVYDGQGLIFEANGAAQSLLGRDLVGRHWQELVTPGSTVQVAPMLEIIRREGHAVSRFRMPRADGSLVEFDSFTEATDDTFATTMRPIGPEERSGQSTGEPVV